MARAQRLRPSIFYKTVTRLIFPILWILSLFLFLRGHNEPGGGFIAGLMAAIAYLLVALGYGVAHARRLLVLPPYMFIAIGLSLGLVSGFVGPFYDSSFFTGIWWKLPLPDKSLLAVGTPILFDLGVYLDVLGVITWIVFVLLEDKEEAVPQ